MPNRPLDQRACLVASSLFFTFFSASTLGAAIIQVNSTADGAPAVDASCTLREAMVSTSTNASDGRASGSTNPTLAEGANGVSISS